MASRGLKFIREELSNPKCVKFTAQSGDGPLPFLEAMRLMAKPDDEFIGKFLVCLRGGVEYDAYFFETPGMNKKEAENPFEFVLLPVVSLFEVTADVRSFSKHFGDCTKSVVAFESLSGDATMIVPCPPPPSQTSERMDHYAHLASFVRHSPAETEQPSKQARRNLFKESSQERQQSSESSKLSQKQVLTDSKKNVVDRKDGMDDNEKRVGDHADKVDDHEKRMDDHEYKEEDKEERVDDKEERVDDKEERVDDKEERVDDKKEWVDDFTDRVDGHAKGVKGHKERVDDHNVRVVELWREVGAQMLKRLQNDPAKPVWLSTCGTAVYWLHVRLDDRPKYYSYKPYKQVRNITKQ